jgi:hypothetical protein
MKGYKVFSKLEMDDIIDFYYREYDSRDGIESTLKAFAFTKALNHFLGKGYILVAVTKHGYVFAEN